MHYRLLFTVLFCISTQSVAQPSSLAQSDSVLTAALQSRVLRATFTELRHEFHHSFSPWQQTRYFSRGEYWTDAVSFHRADTVIFIKSGKRYPGRVVYTPGMLLNIPYGQNDIAEISEGQINRFIEETARYSPAGIVRHFLNAQSGNETAGEDGAIYKLNIGDAAVGLYLNQTTLLPDSVSVTEYDEYYGDLRTTVLYSGYTVTEGVPYPQQVIISKMNGRLIDTIDVLNARIIDSPPALIDAPDEYSVRPDEDIPATVTARKYNEHIHLLEFPQADEQTMLVEYADFFVAIEAPLNSASGELILNEARKIAPGKPIRYVSFSHFHPHYTGALRPLIHHGATVLCTEGTIPYINDLATAPHTLRPDILEREPEPLQAEAVGEKYTITDGSYSLEIHFIGEKSRHTEDYLIYYFPAERLLFEGDLVWIKKDGPVTPAGDRQKGLFQAVKDIGLEIETVIQSWPVNMYDVKSEFPFEELEASMNAE